MLLLGLIGSGLHASRSPAMHEAAARAHGLACEYRLLDLGTPSLSGISLRDLVAALERDGFAGFNVTHPAKQTILPLLTELSDEARDLGAVNTVVLTGGRRTGDNTDWTGFRQGLLDGLPGARLDRVVQLGAGGAGAATAYALLSLGCSHLTLVDLSGDRARQLAARLKDRWHAEIEVADSPDTSLRYADGLVHATPTGMAGHPGLPLDASLLRPDLWVAEVVYFPLETALLLEARRAGCRTVNGAGMALHQAARAFQLFTGLEPPLKRMREAFLRAGQTV
jgi:shikimate dehydrogenase